MKIRSVHPRQAVSSRCNQKEFLSRRIFAFAALFKYPLVFPGSSIDLQLECFRKLYTNFPRKSFVIPGNSIIFHMFNDPDMVRFVLVGPKDICSKGRRRDS